MSLSLSGVSVASNVCHSNVYHCLHQVSSVSRGVSVVVVMRPPVGPAELEIVVSDNLTPAAAPSSAPGQLDVIITSQYF